MEIPAKKSMANEVLEKMCIKVCVKAESSRLNFFLFSFLFLFLFLFSFPFSIFRTRVRVRVMRSCYHTSVTLDNMVTKIVTSHMIHGRM